MGVVSMRRFVLLLGLVGCGSVEKLAADASVDADPCTGTCECKVDTDCTGMHTVCDDQVTTRTCACAAGYTSNAGACEWTGVVNDPGFQSAAVWGKGTDVTIDNNLNEVGMLEVGAARIGMTSLCQLEHVTQAVTMPRLSRAEPLVALASYRFTGAGFINSAPAFALGTTWRDDLARARTQWITTRVCLGAAQYAPESSKGKGAVMMLDLMPVVPDGGCMSDSLDIDHIEVRPADPGECPTPGTSLNGDAEGTGGWKFVALGANGTLATGMIEANVGEGNTRGARVFGTNRCMNATATDRVSIPDASVPSALSFYTRGSTTSQDFFRFGSASLPTLGGTNVGTTHKMCIPAFMRGGAFDFSGSIDGSGACADIVNFELILDNVKIVTDATCGTDPSITDPGFESPLELVGALSTPGKSISRALNDPNQAHTGNGALQLATTFQCQSPSWQANVITPPSSGGGPALKFFYKTAAPVQYHFVVGSVGVAFTPTQDGQWHQGVSCLDPRFVGRNQPVQFTEAYNGGSCLNAIAQEQALVDDLTVGTDPSCPM